ncbi:hypothetical protein Gotur_016045, partial [Gossypium turneri]
AHRRRVHNSALLPEDLSRQSLFWSCQHPNFLKEANKHNWDDTSGYEEKRRRLHLEYLRVGHIPQSTRAYR